MENCKCCHNPLSTNTHEHYGTLYKPVCRDCWFAHIPDIRNYKRPAHKGDYVASLANRTISGFVVKRIRRTKAPCTFPQRGYIVRLAHTGSTEFIPVEKIDVVIDGQVYNRHQQRLKEQREI